MAYFSSHISGKGAQQSADYCLQQMAQRVGGSGGVIVVSKKGEVAKSFTTAHMPWAYAQQGQLHHGMCPGEQESEDILAS